jgi:DNA primase
MEGYLDVITAHQFGINNAVASLGTAMTQEHAKMLMRNTNNVIMAFDADPAGIKAALRGLDILQSVGCHVQVVSIPGSKDPDEFIRKCGPEEFKKLLTDKALSLVEFKMAQSAGKYDLTTVTGKISALGEVLPNLARIRNAVEREEYLRVLGQDLNLSWDTILSELRKYQREHQKSKSFRDKNVKNRNNTHDVQFSAQQKPAAKLEGQQKAEYTLLRLVLESKENLELVQKNLGLEKLKDPSIRQITEVYCEEIKTNGECFPTNLFTLLPEEKLSSVLSRVLMLEIPMENVPF